MEGKVRIQKPVAMLVKFSMMIGLIEPNGILVWCNYIFRHQVLCGVTWVTGSVRVKIEHLSSLWFMRYSVQLGWVLCNIVQQWEPQNSQGEKISLTISWTILILSGSVYDKNILNLILILTLFFYFFYQFFWDKYY